MKPSFIGQRIGGRYRLDDLLGEGGKGTVYRAYDLNLGNQVVVRIMPETIGLQSKYIPLLKKEAEIAISLDHPSIVRTLAAEESAAGFFIVNEFIDGFSLKYHLQQLVRRKQFMTFSDSLQIGIEMAEALGYAHNLEINHRDVSPKNILISQTIHTSDQITDPLRVKLSDFGLMNMIEVGLEPGATVGTLNYAAPEQFRGDELDGRTDLYSLGAVLYELVTNLRPYDFRSISDALAIFDQKRSPTPAGDIRRGTPQQITSLLAKALAIDPDDRFLSGQEMAAALREAKQAVTPTITTSSKAKKEQEPGVASVSRTSSDTADDKQLELSSRQRNGLIDTAIETADDSLLGDIAAHLAPNARIWFVTANPKQYDWNWAFERGSVNWTEVTNPVGQHNISLTRAGDLVIAYRSTPDKYITGIGTIAEDPVHKTDHWTVRIEARQRFEHGVSLDELKGNVPDLAHVQNPISSFSGVRMDEWNTIRELILERNPELDPNTLPLPAGEKRRLRITLTPPRDAVLESNRRYRHTVVIENIGSVIFRKGESLLLSWRWSRENEPDDPYHEWNWTVDLSGDLLPGGRDTNNDIDFEAPADAGVFSTEWQTTAWDLTWKSTPGLVTIGIYAADITAVKVRDAFSGESTLATLLLYNSGGLTWDRGDHFSITCRFEDLPDDADMDKVQSWERRLGREVPFADNIRFQGLSLKVPELPSGEYNLTWEVTSTSHGAMKTVSVPAPVQVTALPPVTVKEEPVAAEADTEASAPEPPAEADEDKIEKEPIPEGRKTDQADSGQAGAAETERAVERQKRLAKMLSGSGPTINYHISTTGLEKYKPPDEKKATNVVRLRVYSNTVDLIFAGDTYSSPNRIDRKKLSLLKGDPEKYGEALFRAVIHDEISAGGLGQSTTWAGYSQALLQSNGRFRLELVIDPNNALLHSYDWEFLKQPPGSKGRYLALFERSPLYRLVFGPTKKLDEPEQPLKILVAICNPVTLQGKVGNGKPERLRGLFPIVEETERPIIKRALQQLKDDGLADYHLMQGQANGAVSLDAIRDELNSGGYNALHLLCHGKRFREDEIVDAGFYLVMETKDRKEELVTPEAFVEAVNAASKLRLIVLASCDSAVGDDTGSVLRSLGLQLVQAGVPAVIAMQKRVHMETAQRFAHHFYNDLARSGCADMALAATRLSLKIDERLSDRIGQWGIPVLLTSIKGGGPMFKVDEERAAAVEKPAFQPKAYEELSSRGDPRPELLSEALEELAQSIYGTGSMPFVSLPSIMQDAMIDQGRPLAEEQNIGELNEKITSPVALDADELGAYVRGKGMRLDDIVFAQVASALNVGKHVVLIGPPGTGKTSLAHDICKFAKERGFSAGHTLTTATADWTTFDTIGGYVPTRRQTLHFRLGIFLKAVRLGQWLVIDELNRAEIDKAFGELFTLLSGQQVDLPYSVGEHPVRILPARDSKEWPKWVPDTATGRYDYVVHPNWRIVGTMNVYDKSYLFNMSFAFMRRFAFVDVDLPYALDESSTEEKQVTIYERLCRNWLNEYARLPELEETSLERQVEDRGLTSLETKLKTVLDPQSMLMRRRALGPAIAQDMIAYIGSRYRSQKDVAQLGAYLVEAFLLYAVPQLDGLDRKSISKINREVRQTLGGEGEESARLAAPVEKRIRALYPHMSDEDWEEA